MKKFEKRMNPALEYLTLTVVCCALAAGCFGYWWQLFWAAAFTPIWATIRKENRDRRGRRRRPTAVVDRDAGRAEDISSALNRARKLIENKSSATKKPER